MDPETSGPIVSGLKFTSNMITPRIDGHRQMRLYGLPRGAVLPACVAATHGARCDPTAHRTA